MRVKKKFSFVLEHGLLNILSADFQDSPEENEFSSPVGLSHSHEIEEPKSTTSDETERPSPVSVLEPLFSDNEISPASTGSRPGEQPPSSFHYQRVDLVYVLSVTGREKIA